jgi:hypothetical protein
VFLEKIFEGKKILSKDGIQMPTKFQKYALKNKGK